jgi:hypothetical protein
MSSQNFTHMAQHLVNARVNWAGATFRALLVTAIPTAAQIDTWAYRSDVTTEVPATGGYVAGGFVVTASIGTLDSVNNRLPITYTASNPVYSGATITARGMLVYSVEATPSTSPLLHYVDFGAEKTTTAGEWIASFDTPCYINT